jgi:cation transport regulator
LPIFENNMIYKKLNDLPQEIQHELPFEAQKIFLEAYRDGWDDFESPLTRDTQTTRHEAANRFAWLAVKDDFKKTKEGQWIKKEPKPRIVFKKSNPN